MRRGSLVLVLFSLALAFAASGCGESDSEAETTVALSKAEFVKQANAICAEATRELIKTSEQFAKEKSLSEEKPPTDTQVRELSARALPMITRQVEELRGLSIPAGEEAELNAFFAAADEAIEKGEQDPSAIYGTDGGAFAKANRLATEYGLDKCGE